MNYLSRITSNLESSLWACTATLLFYYLGWRLLFVIIIVSRALSIVISHAPTIYAVARLLFVSKLVLQFALFFNFLK
jgi:hypothetical protein